MSQDLWTAVDQYVVDHLVPTDEALEAALAATAEAGMPDIGVAPTHGKLLHLLARLRGARTILEIGTLAGYSTIWLARALPPDGRLVTLEADPRHAEVAQANLARAGLAGVVEVRVGRALDTLPQLTGPFDLVFIDADKVNNPQYLSWATTADPARQRDCGGQRGARRIRAGQGPRRPVSSGHPGPVRG